MKAIIEYQYPQPDFWDSYQKLWRESLYRSAFQAPHYLQCLAQESPTALAIFQFYLEERLSGAVLFKKEGNQYQFLSDLLSGQNFFVLHLRLGQDAIKAFFDNLLRLAKGEGLSLVLNKQPAWASYMPQLLQACEHSRLFWEIAPFSVCPVTEFETAAGLAQYLGKSRHLRKKTNQLISQHGISFEVLRDNQYLDEWLEAYFHWHIKRWKDSPTPSNYTNPQARVLFTACLRGWIEDGLAVRFAFRKAEGERIALCIGLLQENTLVDYYMVYDPAYAQYSPSKGLLPLIGKWMEEQGLNVLDMGYGGYEYKYEFCNKEQKLNTIYISDYLNLPIIFKSEIEKFYRGHPQLMKFYRKNIKPFMSKTNA
jgi:hypothetical protein